MEEIEIFKVLLARGHLKTAKKLKKEVLAAFEKAEEQFNRKRQASPDEEAHASKTCIL